MKLPRPLEMKLGLLRTARQVQKRTGKSVLSQLREITSLRFGSGKLNASEYYLYGVYDDVRFSSPSAKREVVGWNARVLGMTVNDRYWRAICDDKLIFYALLKGLDFPFAQIHAIYHAGKRPFGTVPAFSTPETMANFLRTGMQYPFFGKTVDGSYGKGASAVARYDSGTDRLHLLDGGEMPVEEYVRQFVMPRRGGYLFQEMIKQHPAIDRISGGRVGTLRMIVLNQEEGPRLFRSIWRVPVGRNITDNFLHGTQGNLVAYVDPESGVVERVIQVKTDRGLEANGRRTLGEEVHVHPDTREQVSGITLPEWPAIVSLCLNAASTLPGIRYQGWDIAMGHEGPSILELNFRGGIDITQVPGVRGFNDAEFRAFLARYAGNGKRR
jgi:hypothetical protein